MYQPSNSPIFPNRQADLAGKAAASDARIEQARQMTVQGRIALFNTLLTPGQIADTFGVPAGVNAAKLQAQTEAARASGMMGSGEYAGSEGLPPRMPPEVVPMAQIGGCGNSAVYAPAVPSPGGMPRMAPVIIDGLYYRGADSTIGRPAETLETEGGVMNWIADHPLLTLALAGAGVLALSRRGR